MLGETKLVPPRKSKIANYLSVRHICFRVVRGDLLETLTWRGWGCGNPCAACNPSIVGSMSGHKEGSKALARYRDIDQDQEGRT